MLIRFEVENFRSILEPIELSMVAVDQDRIEARPHHKLGVSVLATAGIFGPNASGKSNVLAALAWLRDAVGHSLRQWDDTIPVEPFAFGEATHRDSSFALEMSVDGIRFEYLLDLNSQRVSFEALYHYPEGRRRRIFKREQNDLVLQRGLAELSGTRALLTDRSLALSIIRRFDEPITSEFARQLLRVASLGQPLTRFRHLPGPAVQSTLRMFDTPQEEELDLFLDEESRLGAQSVRQRAMSLLRLADLGVTDVEVEETKVDIDRSNSYARRSPQLVHSSKQEQLAFEYKNESAGTRAWFELIGPVLVALQRGSIVLFDELDASLHPILTAQLVNLFQSRSSNPGGAQLLFTSHDTNLLNHLNRDEVWLTQKNSDGATRFAALSDFAGERVRRSQNIESGYLGGRFGALPDTARPEVLRDLGLIG